MLTELVIRRAKPSDAAGIAAIEAACFDDAWKKEAIEKEITYSETVTNVVAVADGILIGYMNVQIIMDECDIRRVAVLPDFRSMHVASILMSSLLHFTEESGVKSHFLEVRESNDAARGLYGKFGFLENGRRKKYYDGVEDAILMIRIGDPMVSDPDTLS